MRKVMNDEVIDEAYKIIVDNSNKFLKAEDIYNLLSPKTKETIKFSTFRHKVSYVTDKHPDVRAIRGYGFTIDGSSKDSKVDDEKEVAWDKWKKNLPSQSIVKQKSIDETKRIGGDITKFTNDIHKDAGDFWTVRRSDGRVDYFLELARNDVNVIGIPLYLCDDDPSKSTCWNEPYDISVKVPHGWLFGNAMNIKTKPKKYFIERYAPAPGEWFKYVKDMIATVLDISKTEVKEVEEIEPTKKGIENFLKGSLLEIRPSLETAVEPITVDGIAYTKEDIIRLITERDMYSMFYNDILSFIKGGHS